jgi:hypothetical protein
MALWMIERLTESLGRALRRGLNSKVQRFVAQREVMVRLCRFCVECIEQRAEVWAMMQSLSDLSSSNED